MTITEPITAANPIHDAYYHATVTEDEIALAYKADLHARCTFYRLTARFRECQWLSNSTCKNCGREQPQLDQVVKRMEREHHDTSPVLRRLDELATEFDAVAVEYAGAAGSHNALLHHETARAAEQLRTVRQYVINGVYTQAHGVLWIRAGWRILQAIGRSNKR